MSLVLLRFRTRGYIVRMLLLPAPAIIAEVGCNHKGDLVTAKQMIATAAAFCKVDVVKFQKRTPREFLTPAEYAASHPFPAHAYGKTYGEHREFLEFTRDQHAELKECAKEHGIAYASSVWDRTSAGEIISLDPAYIKVPSACNLDFALLEVLAGGFRGEIHVSLGMTTVKEEEKIASFFERRGRLQDVVLYSCVSGYPVAHEDLSLLDIRRLIEKYGSRIKGVGFSGHHLGIVPDVAAVALGARYVERHLTLNRAWKGTDHAASLVPDEMRCLVCDIRDTAKALTHKKKEILDIEVSQRSRLKRGLAG